MPPSPAPAELQIYDRPDDGPPGCAYLRSDGAVRVFGPGGAPMGPARDRWRVGSGMRLLASGLSLAECRQIADLPAEAAADRARSLAARRAGAEGRELRQVRRGEQASGSIVLQGSRFVMRLPDGSGWGGSAGLRLVRTGWRWTEESCACRGTRILARGLSRADCDAVADEAEGLADKAVDVLRTRWSSMG